jgi:hypothetical protein
LPMSSLRSSKKLMRMTTIEPARPKRKSQVRTVMVAWARANTEAF